MKLSNKILIGFFSFLFLYMIVAFTEMRFKGDLNRLDSSNSITETVDIPPLNYLVLSDIEQRVTIFGSDTPRIEINSVSGDVQKSLKYDIVGDTLIIQSIELLKKESVNLSIYVAKSTFSGLSSKNSGLIISDLEQKTLDIHQNDGWIRMSDSNKIGRLNLNAQNSAYFNFLEGEIDTLDATIENAEIYITQPIKLAKGYMSKGSNLHLRGASEIHFKKDETSRIIMN